MGFRVNWVLLFSVMLLNAGFGEDSLFSALLNFLLMEIHVLLGKHILYVLVVKNGDLCTLQGFWYSVLLLVVKLPGRSESVWKSCSPGAAVENTLLR